tara:strand:+ start:1508 stop:2557 length:1050 start_codon:yes stop_codon:yes gene_type:complete
MASSIKINKKIISKKNYPFIIAEMSGNHKKSLKRALKIVDLAADCGANAIKLQTFKPDKVTFNLNKKDFVINDKSSPWYKRKIFDLFEDAYTPWEWHKEIFQKAKSRGLEFLSTPFHEEAVDFLEKLNVPCYKVASFENNHLPLIKYISKTKKPMIISTGMASFKELSNIYNILRKNKNEYIFLKCTSAYPASAKSFNLNTLEDLQKKFKCIVGLSDHSIGSAVASSAVALGARVIEKHLTISKVDKAIDSFFSSDKSSFKNYVQDIKLSFDALGKNYYGSTKNEKSSLQERRSIYVKKNIKKGEIFNTDNIAVIRPSYGLDPIYFDKILGKKSKKNLRKGDRLTKKKI